MPKKQRAADAIKANPQKSDRAIAADLGISAMTVGEARREAGVSHLTPEREGRLFGPGRSRGRGPGIPTSAKGSLGGFFAFSMALVRLCSAPAVVKLDGPDPYARPLSRCLGRVENAANVPLLVALFPDDIVVRLGKFVGAQ